MIGGLVGWFVECLMGLGILMLMFISGSLLVVVVSSFVVLVRIVLSSGFGLFVMLIVWVCVLRIILVRLVMVMVVCVVLRLMVSISLVWGLKVMWVGGCFFVDVVLLVGWRRLVVSSVFMCRVMVEWVRLVRVVSLVLVLVVLLWRIWKIFLVLGEGVGVGLSILIILLVNYSILVYWCLILNLC